MIKKISILLAVTMILSSAAPHLYAADKTDSKGYVPSADFEDTSMIFRDADIRDVLSLIAQEYSLNIVMSDDVTGTVSLRLQGASLLNTLDAILLSRGFDYEIRDNIIRVASAEVLQAERDKRQSRQEIEPLVTEVIVTKYLDANDLKPVVERMLTERGSVSVLERRTFKGFRFGTGQTTSGSSGSSSTGSITIPSTGDLVRSRAGENESPRSNTLMVVDVRSQIDRIKNVIKEVDVMPRQILIDAKILEVNTNSLEDLGLDFNNRTTFSAGSNNFNPLTTDVNSGSSNTGIDSGIFTNAFPSSTDSGVHAVFQHLNGEDFTVILHALLQDQRNKILSAPQIMTIENQEAAILVGEQFPIFEANVTDQGTTTESLSFFQPIGISLQVIAQVTADNDVIMIIHPTVSSLGANVTGTTGLTQPRINIREADTRVLIKNGETLVIGGLLQDDVDERYFRIPLLGYIPFLGKVFTRKQVDSNQRNLLIFITPSIIHDKTARLNKSEALTLSGLNDPKSYGLIKERRDSLADLYKAAKKNFNNEQFGLARMQFLRILSINPNHDGAVKYLKKLNALPERRPVG